MKYVLLIVCLFCASLCRAQDTAYTSVEAFVSEAICRPLHSKLPDGIISNLKAAVIYSLKEKAARLKKEDPSFTEANFLAGIHSDHVVYYTIGPAAYFVNVNYNYAIGESDRELYFKITAAAYTELYFNEAAAKTLVKKYRVTHFHFTAVDQYNKGMFIIKTGGYVNGDPDCCPSYVITYEASLAGNQLTPRRVVAVKKDAGE